MPWSNASASALHMFSSNAFLCFFERFRVILLVAYLTTTTLQSLVFTFYGWKLKAAKIVNSSLCQYSYELWQHKFLVVFLIQFFLANTGHLCSRKNNINCLFINMMRCFFFSFWKMNPITMKLLNSTFLKSLIEICC